LIWEQKLIITEQTCLLEEKFSKNGVQKNVHVVVKNTPFTITVVSLDKQAINFTQFSADVQLVYDCPTLKEVDFVKLKPMEFKLKPSEEGDQITGTCSFSPLFHFAHHYILHLSDSLCVS
jgi:hypothetical protein